MRIRQSACILLIFVSASVALHAETGRDAWLRYPRQRGAPKGETFPEAVVSLDRSPVTASAQNELVRGVRGIRDRLLRIETELPRENALVLGTFEEIRAALPAFRIAANLPADSFALQSLRGAGGVRYTVIAGPNVRGVLYGAFAWLRKVQLGEAIDKLHEYESPAAPIRWVNQWDNLDGSIERGYGGRSIFWSDGHASPDLQRVNDYGRLLASIGIDGCAIANVNADARLLSPDLLPDIVRIATALRPWGVQVALPVDFGSPKTIGKLDTFDPLDPRVAAWWKAQADTLYGAIPDLAGFLIKADSEGRAGPSLYRRTHADAANVMARALKPHGGLLFYRGFVYDHRMDWRDPKNDRARAAYDNLQPLDGRFDDNVIIQIKNGPIDFQVREPVSPLIGALEKTNQAMELQIAQEYMGQARHLVFLAPQWKEILDFDLHAGPVPTPVKEIVTGKIRRRPLGGFVGVANVGLDENWMGNQLSQANLFAFGRLAWNPNLSARAIVYVWTRLTFGNDPRVVRAIDEMQLTSWRTYENYTGPLGLQTLTDIVGNHYGVSVEASENNSWGQWHRADARGVGMDRSTATGTGYASQYAPAAARLYENLATTPDDLLLFFHHVPYGYSLHSGKTVIQSIYDSHYAGFESVQKYGRDWESLQGLVDEQRFREVRAQLAYQAGQAELWRDAVCNWFLRASGIPDRAGRVAHDPARTEAESMKLVGYAVQDVKPWEAASSGKAAVCAEAKCTAAMTYRGAAGWHALRVRYFDQNTGAARFRLSVGKQAADEWIADARLPSAKIDGTTSTVRITPALFLCPGDTVRIEGEPDGGDRAALDYVEIVKFRPNTKQNCRKCNYLTDGHL